MIGFPPPEAVLMQGLLTSLLVLTVPLLMAFGQKLKVSGVDALLMIPIYPTFAALTILIFTPFEGEWGDMAFGPMGMLRSLSIGGIVVTLGTLYTQRREIVRMGAGGVSYRLGSVFVIGMVWGLVWLVSGMLLNWMGCVSNG